jgi:hypothetical protein
MDISSVIYASLDPVCGCSCGLGASCLTYCLGASVFSSGLGCSLGGSGLIYSLGLGCGLATVVMTTMKSVYLMASFSMVSSLLAVLPLKTILSVSAASPLAYCILVLRVVI